jgi:hypothetical protein
VCDAVGGLDHVFDPVVQAIAMRYDSGEGVGGEGRVDAAVGDFAATND